MLLFSLWVGNGTLEALTLCSRSARVDVVEFGFESNANATWNALDFQMIEAGDYVLLTFALYSLLPSQHPRANPCQLKKQFP